MLLGRILGWILMALALLAAGGDGLAWLQSGHLVLSALGEFWYRIDHASLGLAQVLVERYLWPPLWDPGIITLLRWPAVPVLGGLGLLLLLVFRKRPPRRRRFGALA